MTKTPTAVAARAASEWAKAVGSMMSDEGCPSFEREITIGNFMARVLAVNTRDGNYCLLQTQLTGHAEDILLSFE
ncbi:MAG TPA: hypothetical protein VJ698_18985 [Noviherbaspirillum sp.]|uniref:hypothetical protein n=1 Tax=Noviherbaspirillum sp. TaxID=1926288 RepID=UPI002B4799AC|nr:hypothetical protein [Noviherbaspirillum sp.]HJV87562.1 hypothetical protein [Noviherbaspirillum sp.]